MRGGLYMTHQNQLEKMRREILGAKEDTKLDDIFEGKLEDAKNVFLDKVYPFDKNKNEIPERYLNWQTRCAIELYYLEDDGNYLSYSENGLSWTKLSEGLTKELLSELPPPEAGVPK